MSVTMIAAVISVVGVCLSWHHSPPSLFQWSTTRIRCPWHSFSYPGFMWRNIPKMCKHSGTFSHWEFEQKCCVFVEGNKALKSCASPLNHKVSMGSVGTSSELELVPNTTLRFYMLGNIPFLLSQQYFLSFLYPWSPTQTDLWIWQSFLSKAAYVAFRVYIFYFHAILGNQNHGCGIASVMLYCLKHCNVSEVLVKI